MERYVFSGTLTNDMVKMLENIPDFKPMDVLVTQVDRSGVTKMLEYKNNSHIIKSFMLDSGAFTAHRMGITVDIDEYIQYANSLDEHCWAIVELDEIPGTFGKPKSKEDYEHSVEVSWNNFLYMYPKMKNPKKLMAVYHQGEPIEALHRMLEWKDPEGQPLELLCISPANDNSQRDKNIYLKEVYDIIRQSPNPNVKTHLLGMTSMPALSMFPCYSADSISHRLIAAYNKVFTQKWGVVSLSDKSRTVKSKSNMSFIETCDSETRAEFIHLVEHYGFDLDTLKEQSSQRVCMSIVEMQKALSKEFKYDSSKILRTKKLF